MADNKITGYLAFNDQTQDKVISKYNAYEKFDNIVRGSTENVTTRKGFHHSDYLSQRPQDAIPTKFNDVISLCRHAYLRVGVVRNVIDLQTDFACEDVKLIHPDKDIEAFLKVWMGKVKLQDAIDEFVRHFLIDGNVVVRRGMAKISEPVESQWVKRAMAKKEVLPEPEKLYTERLTNKREIPWRYTFLNVAALYWRDSDLGKITGEKQLAFRPSPDLINTVRSPSEPFQKTLVDRIPGNIKNMLVKGDGLVDLDMNSLYIAHNKKDSWEDWGPPFLYSVLADIHFKDKLRQAETAALDGWVNVIRLWKLGDHKEGFLPGEAPIDKLIGILENNVGGGTIDIVWDSMIDMKEYYPPVTDILGSEKYQQVNRDILIGLGVPEVLIGGQGANFSNSWIQLKTLVEKLKYIRGKVKDWLQQEINVLCEAMEIEPAPKIRFNQVNLEDENISRKLIVGLLDRGVISVEAVLQSYGEDFLIEVERMRGEKEAKIKVKSPFDPKPTPAKGQPGQGRPSQTKDVSRKTRTAKPRRAAASNLLYIKGLEIVHAFDDKILPIYMNAVGASNARKLTAEQKEDIDNLRMLVLSSIKPEDDLNKLEEVSYSCDQNYNAEVVKCINKQIKSFIKEQNNTPNLSQRKVLEALGWTSYYNSQQEG